MNLILDLLKEPKICKNKKVEHENDTKEVQLLRQEI